MKEFFLKLFDKSIAKGCAINLPVDFICAEKQALEELITENAGKVKPATGIADASDPAKTGEQNNTQLSKSNA